MYIFFYISEMLDEVFDQRATHWLDWEAVTRLHKILTENMERALHTTL